MPQTIQTSHSGEKAAAKSPAAAQTPAAVQKAAATIILKVMFEQLAESHDRPKKQAQALLAGPLM
jgi:hypothetical protein